jgi:hypothetical protein
MKDCDSKRSWIGGEGLPSRYLGKGREREPYTRRMSHLRQCKFSGMGHIDSMSFGITLTQIVQDNDSIKVTFML